MPTSITEQQLIRLEKAVRQKEARVSAWSELLAVIRAHKPSSASELPTLSRREQQIANLIAEGNRPVTKWLQGNPQHTLALALSGSMAVSDLPGRFEHAAVYREVYRHLDTCDQMTCGLGFSPAGDQAYIIGFNRNRKGFSARDRQIAESVAIILQRCVPLIFRLQNAETYLNKLRATFGYPVERLTPYEIEILRNLLLGKTQTRIAGEFSISPVVLRRRVATMREKLGFASTRHLVVALRDAALGS